MNVRYKEVRFDKWCQSCKHKKNRFSNEGVSDEYQHPCGECLEAIYSMREGSEKPEYWEEDK